MSAVAQIDPAEAQTRIDDGAFLLDVREPYEWEAGRAEAATLVPLRMLEVDIESLPADRDIVVVCRSGVRSDKAAAFLVGSGRSAVNLAGGMQAWHAAGLPVVTDDGTPGKVV